MQKIEIVPLDHEVKTKVLLPGSKSYTNRALVIASLAHGRTKLSNCLLSDDTKYLINTIKQLGVDVMQDNNQIIVDGASGNFLKEKKELYFGGSGTGIRLMTGLCTLAGDTVLTGEERLQERPIAPLVDALVQLGAKIEAVGKNGCPPVKIFDSVLRGGMCRILGNVSSQFISSLLMIAPYAENDVKIEVIGELVSKPYIDVTMDIMHKFGIDVINEDHRKFKVMSGKRYVGRKYDIETDYSAASYFFAIPAITGGKTTVKNINPNSVQGDKVFLEILVRMGAVVTKSDEKITVACSKGLLPIDIDLKDAPDLVPTVSILAAFAKGKSLIRNIGNLRLKESDRIASIVDGLNKIGTKTEEEKDSITIFGGTEMHGAKIETFNDHRIAMAFSLVGLKVPGIIIRNPDCVNKSFPGFWDKLSEIGVELKY
ncbi:MAG: 3-phosphoshikimate 1-carboxyvinyltransferase [Nanoarchaeota archaeon]|nr:3-phosphoshikimate 1-carboxyvinyltransferase [Nanoarchaeota archaeon]